MFGVVTANTANFPVMMNRVSAVPMITVRLPVMTANDQNAVSLADSMKDPQYYLENGVLVPKVQEILYTRGVIIFHVTRRTQIPRYQKMINPGNWTDLLPTISAYERINSRPVTAENNIQVGFSASVMGSNAVENHILTSIVALNVSPVTPDLIIGTCALLVNGDSIAQKYLVYNPQYATLDNAEVDPTSGAVNRQFPISKLDLENDQIERSFSELSARYGTIYIYRQENNNERILTIN
jgi:hypothetical protein